LRPAARAADACASSAKASSVPTTDGSSGTAPTATPRWCRRHELPPLAVAEHDRIFYRLRLAGQRDLERQAFVRTLFEDQDRLQKKRARHRQAVDRLVALIELR